MKKITLLILLFICSISIAQDKENTKLQDIDKKHELKINAFNLIAFSSLDLSYERLINSESSYGIALFYNFTDIQNDDIGFPKKFSLTPYYRWFFSERNYARGFFVEGFGMLNTYEENIYNYDDGTESFDKETGFALGISVGGKFVTKKGFTTEVYLGVGRNLINADNSVEINDIVGRFGISLGYRF
ncbi:DUF3575 domain-containing protein [uncultured Polaribacter sp.]|uniref:DUF3575 domain-containing protein n=1 Tax=uncultured Polaribacter sp. TaxID=174711 RepID=UPI00260D0310|nr:DUF3575 domain-containing protein [uncultured Polaribacter sp.]